MSQPGHSDQAKAGVSPEDLLANPESVRTKILVGAAIILLIVTLGYIHDAMNLVTKHEVRN